MTDDVVGRSDWQELGVFLAISAVAIVLTAWQTRTDASVFEPYIGTLPPVAVMIGTTAAGTFALRSLSRRSDFSIVGPGSTSTAVLAIGVAVPLFAALAIGADLVLRYPEDTNVALPDALRFYPAVAVFVEVALHLVPIALLVAVVGPPTGVDLSFWKIAIPVALIEAVAQALFAESLGTAAFSFLQLIAFGVVEVWMFWRFGFVWMLGFRLAYYLLWHIVWGAARLELLW